MKVIYPKVEILTEINSTEILKMLESIGRTCYKSEDKITESSSKDFIAGIIKRGHEAILEHFNISVRFTVDRGISHEIVRHRVASYAQESTRYCNYSKDKFNNNITFIDISNGLKFDSKCKNLSKSLLDSIYNEWLEANLDAEKHYMNLLELGATPQIARSVLNNSTKTELCMTANIREWRHFLKLRCAKNAHPQMREVAIELLEEFKMRLPELFGDIDPDKDDLDIFYKETETKKLSDDEQRFNIWCAKKGIEQISFEDYVTFLNETEDEVR